MSAPAHARPPAVATTPRGRRLAALAVAIPVLASAVVVLISAAADTWPYSALGNDDPGALVRFGSPLLRLSADATGTLCVGSLVFAAFFTDTSPTGRLRPRAYAAVRGAGYWAGAWFLSAAALVPFDVADQSGQPLSGATSAGVASAAAGGPALWAALETPLAWLITAAAALTVALTCRALLRWQPTVGILALAVLGVLPPLATASATDAVELVGATTCSPEAAIAASAAGTFGCAGSLRIIPTMSSATVSDSATSIRKPASAVPRAALS